jgi:hypothetical protein
MAIRTSEYKVAKATPLQEVARVVAEATNDAAESYIAFITHTENGPAIDLTLPILMTTSERMLFMQRVIGMATSIRKTASRTTPVVVRKVDETSPFKVAVEKGDYFVSVADFNEAIGFSRLRTQTSRQIQKACNRDSHAEFHGVHVSFATLEEVEKAAKLAKANER